MAPAENYRFGPYTLDPAAQVLFHHDTPVPIQPKPFELLVTLVRAEGRLLLKDDLIGQIWAGTFVEDGSLARTVSTLRSILHDRDEAYIKTVPKRGYRFVAPVERVANGSPAVTIAVLPFAELGTETDDLLGFGITDSLIGLLSRMRSFAVRPTSAVLRYEDRHRTSLEAAEELDVDYVLEGHVQRRGDRLHVGAQLIARRTQAAVWGQQLDEGPSGVFRIQDAVAERVAETLARRLSPEDRDRLAHRGTNSAEAYLACARGRYYLNRLELGRNAIEQFTRAIDLDPAYALAYAGLADAYYITCAPAGARIEPRTAVPKAKAAVVKALDLDPDLPEARETFAMLRFWEDWDRAGADWEYLHSLELKPNCAHGRYVYAWFLVAAGRFDQAEAELRRALQLDPLSPAIATSLALPMYFRRRYIDAISHLSQLDLAPYFWYRDYLLGLSELAAGEHASARTTLERGVERTGGLVVEMRAACARALALSGETNRAERLAQEIATSRPPDTGAYYVAGVFAALGNPSAAFEWLDTACREHDKWTAWLQVDPALDSLRGDSRWPAVARVCGF